MKMFGDKFYKNLQKLSPWRQSLFALVLAHRQFANYALHTKLTKSEGRAEYLKALQTLYIFHSDKFNHINLETAATEFENYSFMEQDEDNLGLLFAIDASVAVLQSFDAIISHLGDEAKIASLASMSAVILAVQEQQEQELSDEELREQELVEREVNFQVDLYTLLQESSRSKQLMSKLLDLIYAERLSNIGLEFEEDDTIDLFLPLLSNDSVDQG